MQVNHNLRCDKLLFLIPIKLEKNVKVWVILKLSSAGANTFGVTCDPDIAMQYAEDSKNYKLEPFVLLESKQEEELEQKVQNFVFEGKILEACELAGCTELIVRYKNNERLFNMGILDSNDWTRTKNQVAFAILEAVAGK